MGWLTPKCPVDAETQEWIVNSFDWLIEELGIEVLRDVDVLLPIHEHFPEAFDGSNTSIRRMADRICDYMDVDARSIEIRFYRNEDGLSIHPLAASESGQHALGTYRLRKGKYLISLDTSQAGNAQALVATIAHELGHVILLGEERLDPDYSDHEPMTDLLTVFYGFGVFSGNSVFSFEQWTNVGGQGWRAERRGYLTEEMFGYALALFASLRGEVKPEWASYLNTNVKSYFKSSMKVIHANKPELIAKYK